MPNKTPSQHPFLDLFTAAMAPWMTRGPSHADDPPPLAPLPGLTSPELRSLVEHFVAADQDLRQDRVTAALRNLDVAETQIRMALSRGGPAKPAYEAALGDIALAREAAEKLDSRHATGAVADAVKGLLRAVPSP